LYLLSGDLRIADAVMKPLDLEPTGPAAAAGQLRRFESLKRDWHSKFAKPLIELRRDFDVNGKGTMPKIQLALISADPENWTTQLEAPLNAAELIVSARIDELESARLNTWFILLALMIVTGALVLIAFQVALVGRRSLNPQLR
jgi:hypothetical protein